MTSPASAEIGATGALRWSSVTVRTGSSLLLDGVDLSVPAGTWLSLVGPNGAGKTTLLRTLVSGVPHDGEVAVDGRDLRTLPNRARARAVAVVPQQPLIPTGTLVSDYVLLGRVAHQGWRCAPSEHDRGVVEEVLERLGLQPFTRRPVDSLSGGERQRVVIARALAQETAVLALDEPTSALDLRHTHEVLELVEELRVERSLTVLTTLHDLGLAGRYGDRLAVLDRGRIVADGPAAEVLTPSLIRRHWSVDVVCEVVDGEVAVRVLRATDPRPGQEAP